MSMIDAYEDNPNAKIDVLEAILKASEGLSEDDFDGGKWASPHYASHRTWCVVGWAVDRGAIPGIKVNAVGNLVPATENRNPTGWPLLCRELGVSLSVCMFMFYGRESVQGVRDAIRSFIDDWKEDKLAASS